MAKARLEARATGYKGILFRSKSEAIFARCMDLYSESHPTDKLYWEYEPESTHFDSSKGEFDFFVMRVINGKFSSADAFFLEYKPSKPTEVYIAEFGSKANRVLDFLQRHRSPESCPGILVFWCNFFDGSKPNGGVYWGPVYRQQILQNILSSAIADFSSEAKKYRYDLEA